MLFLVPLTLIPFSFKEDFLEKSFTINNYLKNFKHYPKLFVFTFINIIYFLILNIICTGSLKINGTIFINYTTDPILHLVRFVLVLYWIAIILPAPIYMFRKQVNPLRAIIDVYKAGKETRWQQFFTAVLGTVSNLLGLICLVFGLIISIPLSYTLIENYYRRMREYALFDKEYQQELLELAKKKK